MSRAESWYLRAGPSEARRGQGTRTVRLMQSGWWRGLSYWGGGPGSRSECVCIYVCACMYSEIMYMCMCTCIYACVYSAVCMRVCVHMCLAPECACMCVFTHVVVCCVCMHVYVQPLCVHAHAVCMLWVYAYVCVPCMSGLGVCIRLYVCMLWVLLILYFPSNTRDQRDPGWLGVVGGPLACPGGRSEYPQDPATGGHTQAKGLLGDTLKPKVYAVTLGKSPGPPCLSRNLVLLSNADLRSAWRSRMGSMCPVPTTREVQSMRSSPPHVGWLISLRTAPAHKCDTRAGRGGGPAGAGLLG